MLATQAFKGSLKYWPNATKRDWSIRRGSGNRLHQATTTATTVRIIVVTGAGLEEGKESQSTEAEHSADQTNRSGSCAQLDELAHLPTAVWINVTKNCAPVEIFSEI